MDGVRWVPNPSQLEQTWLTEGKVAVTSSPSSLVQVSSTSPCRAMTFAPCVSMNGSALFGVGKLHDGTDLLLASMSPLADQCLGLVVDWWIPTTMQPAGVEPY